MLQALALAQTAGDHDEVPVGAILVANGHTLSQGFNTREHSGKTLGHAELVALENYNAREKSWRLPPDTALFVTVEPCLMCTGALLSARLTHLYYGAADTKNAGITRIRPLIDSGVFDHRFTTVTGAIREPECAALLSAYFKAKRGPGRTP